MVRRLILVLLAIVITIVPAGLVMAQDNGWSEPVNISKSGAAEQPRLVADRNGLVQAFWWDRFDGLTTAYYDGTSWAASDSAPLHLSAGSVPEFVLDTNRRVHAFWLSVADGNSLWHASMPLGDTSWAVIEQLAASALDFRVLALEDGAVAVAYLRTDQNWESPAGIFFRRLEPGTFVWNAPQGLETSAYYRLETTQTAWLDFTADADNLSVIWRDPHNSEYHAAISTNGGWNWSNLTVLSSPGLEMGKPRAIFWNYERILIWQEESSSGCVMVQQSPDGSWQTGLSGLGDCPQNGNIRMAGEQLFWIWGQGNRTITFAAWDGLAWTQPLGNSFTFNDSGSGSNINLHDLHVFLAGNQMYVVGSDGMGEVWFTQSQMNTFTLLEAPRPAWGMVSRLSFHGMAAGESVVTVDTDGLFHVAWIEGSSEEQFNTINYTQIDGDTMSEVITIKIGLEGEFVRQPALLIDPLGWLYLAWSGGTRGEIMFSRARLADAGNPLSWSPSQVISAEAAASPQMAIDPTGRLYILFVVPMNENRGVYLVRSTDQGETWTEADQVFDARAANWESVGEAALTIGGGQDGQTASLHVAWVKEALPGTLPPQGIWYRRTSTNLMVMDALNWSRPFQVAENGAEWPQLAVVAGDLQLVYRLRGDGVWLRHIPVNNSESDVSGWSTASQASGWENWSSNAGRQFSVSVTGSGWQDDGVLHLIGMPTAGRLAYNSWAGGQWDDLQSYILAGWSMGVATWVDTACLTSGGQLGMTWVNFDESGLPAIYWAVRTIPLIDIQPEIPPVPTPTMQTVPLVEPTSTSQPSPTPDLNQIPEVGMSSEAPLILGGGLAAILVVGYMLVKRRNR